MVVELLILRVVHVLGGIFWVGSGLFTTFFLAPTLADMGPVAGQVMRGLQRRKILTILPVVALLTILSGLRLMWLTSGGFSAAYMASGPGRTFSMSGGFAILAFVFSLAVARPAAVRAAALGAEVAAARDEAARARLSAEMDRLRRRGAAASMVAVVLLLLAALGMSVGRYIG